MDIFDSAVLTRVVELQVNPPSFLVDTFFPDVETSTEETIYFDKQTERRRISPFVSPLVAGEIVQDRGYSTSSFSPAYIKDKRSFNPNRQFRRRAGERIGGALTPAQRLQANVAYSTYDQLQMLKRRLEVMAAQVLTTGKATITGDKYPTQIVDFGRLGTLTKVFGGAQAWAANQAGMIESVEDVATEIFEASGFVCTDVIFSTQAWKVFKTDPEFKLLLDKFQSNINPASINRGPLAGSYDQVRYMGAAGDFQFWTYSGRYVDPVDNLEKDMIPQGGFLMASRNMEGVQHFGAIRDEEAGLQPLQYFSKSWVEKDPSVRLLLLQSAPLMVPYRANASAFVQAFVPS